MILVDSSANSAARFATSQTLTGVKSRATANLQSVDNLEVDQFVSHANTSSYISSTIAPTYSIAYSNGSSYVVANTFLPLINDKILDGGDPQHKILSRSNEVVENYLYANTKSFAEQIILQTSNPFSAPLIDHNQTDLTIRQNIISNAYSVSGVDTEVGPNGIALSKHFTTKMTFDTGRLAEDLKVYLTAYKPTGTDVKVYAKFHNLADNEAFDDKAWTPLAISKNMNIVSSRTDTNDFVEYEYSVPSAPESLSSIAGTFTSVSGSATLTGVGTANLTTLTSPGKLVKIYSPLFPANYAIGLISAVTASTIVLSSSLTDTNVLGAGMKVDLLKYPTASFAYKNVLYGGEVCYFGNAGSFFNKYSSVQIKIVLLADTTNIVPSVDQIQVIAVSA